MDKAKASQKQGEEPGQTMDTVKVLLLDSIACSLIVIAEKLKPVIYNGAKNTDETKILVTTATQEVITTDEVKNNLPPQIAKLVNVTKNNNFIIIKPKQFLGSENFEKLAVIARGLNGEYVSAGRDSHFRINNGVQQ